MVALTEQISHSGMTLQDSSEGSPSGGQVLAGALETSFPIGGFFHKLHW